MKHIEYNEKHNVLKNSILFDPIDDIDDFKNSNIMESPNFLLNKSDFKSIHDTQKKTMRFTQSFFKKGKQITNILVDVESTGK